MTLHSTGDASSIFENGRLKPGIYKIRNLQTETFLDIEEYLREVCCRPAKNLEEGRGLVSQLPLNFGSNLMVRSGRYDVLGRDTLCNM